MSRTLPFLLLAIAAPALARDHADPLAGYVAGAARECLDNSQTLGPDVIDDRTILYRENGRRIWRNDLPERCPGLRPYVTLIVIDKFGGQLCRNDRFRFVEPPQTIPGAVCRFGNFTPYTKAK